MVALNVLSLTPIPCGNARRRDRCRAHRKRERIRPPPRSMLCGQLAAGHHRGIQGNPLAGLAACGAKSFKPCCQRWLLWPYRTTGVFSQATGRTLDALESKATYWHRLQKNRNIEGAARVPACPARHRGPGRRRPVFSLPTRSILAHTPNVTARPRRHRQIVSFLMQRLAPP